MNKLYGIAKADLQTTCGKGIRAGESVWVKETCTGKFIVGAPGARRKSAMPWDRVVTIVDPA